MIGHKIRQNWYLGDGDNICLNWLLLAEGIIISLNLLVLQHEPDLLEIRDILESSSLEGKISLMDYRNGVKHWIADIRQRWYSQQSYLASLSLIV